MSHPCSYCGFLFTAPPPADACPQCGAAASGIAPRRGAGRLSDWLRGGVSSMVSGGLHLLALLVCGWIAWGPPAGDEGNEVRIGMLPAVQLTARPREELEAAPVESAATPEPALLEEVAVPAAPTEFAVAGQSLDAQVLVPTLSGTAGGGAPGELVISGGAGALGASASFMGVQARGRRFCIVADCSGSMAGARIEHLKREILETLRTIPQGGRIQVILFNHRPHAFPRSEWLHPRRDGDEIAAWLAPFTGEGGTEPTPAFREAFALRPPPEVIFFMTDGEFSAAAVEEIAAMNGLRQQRTTIHAIAFISREGEPLLRRIAADSGGTYRHVAGF